MCWPQYRFRNSGNSPCNCLLDRPLMYCASLAGDNSGGADNSRCMWCGETAPYDYDIPRFADLAYRVARPLRHPTAHYLVSILCAPHHVILQIVDRMRAMPVLCHSLHVQDWNGLLKADRLKGGGIRPGGESGPLPFCAARVPTAVLPVDRFGALHRNRHILICVEANAATARPLVARRRSAVRHSCDRCQPGRWRQSLNAIYCLFCQSFTPLLRWRQGHCW